MESSTVDRERPASPPRRFSVDWRWMGIAIVTEITAVFLAYMCVNRPVVGAKLTPGERLQHWPVAVVGAAVVALGVLFVARETLRARRLSPVVDSPAEPLADQGRPRIPRALLTQRVPRAGVLAAAAISFATVPLSFILQVSFPLGWLAFLAPWIPIVVVEHSVQVGQLLANDGALRDSHGIFGQLDFELVHFLTDTTLWISLGLLVIIFKGRNAWLVVAFVAASFHQIEHFYLFWINHADNAFYLSGGVAGIMGHHGLIGSPLDRPYLHYTYNFIVLVPMVIALWDEARRVDRDQSRKLAAQAPVA